MICVKSLSLANIVKLNLWIKNYKILDFFIIKSKQKSKFYNIEKPSMKEKQ